MNNLKYFRGSFIVTAIGLIAALYIGGPTALFLAFVLSILEVSVSFDNAVVNATVLKDMSEVWRRRFLTWGMLIAVFGMRIVFPVLIVAVVAGLNPIDALMLAANDQKAYAEHINASNVSLMAFGGAFLMLVGTKFFFDDEKDSHWIPGLEKLCVSLPLLGFLPYALTIASVVGISYMQKTEKDQIDFVISGSIGVVSFLALKMFASWMENREEKRRASAQAAGLATSGGLGLFVYLEVLDATFSFDGVIGAFAITSSLFIIAIGLGIGAMFVRSMTIMLVEKDTLSEFRYLEHGAFYAICTLAGIMLIKSFMHVPELITGLIGAVFIVSAAVHSYMLNKADERSENAALNE